MSTPVQLRSASHKQRHHSKTRETTSSNTNKYYVLNDWAGQCRTIDDIARCVEANRKRSRTGLYYKIRKIQWETILHFATEVGVLA
jgi:hypothetical protein